MPPVRVYRMCIPRKYTYLYTLDDTSNEDVSNDLETYASLAS